MSHVARRSTTYRVQNAHTRQVITLSAEEVAHRIQSGAIDVHDRIAVADGPLKPYWEHPRFRSLAPATPPETEPTRVPGRLSPREREHNGSPARSGASTPSTGPVEPVAQTDALSTAGPATRAGTSATKKNPSSADRRAYVVPQAQRAPKVERARRADPDAVAETIRNAGKAARNRAADAPSESTPPSAERTVDGRRVGEPNTAQGGEPVSAPRTPSSSTGSSHAIPDRDKARHKPVASQPTSTATSKAPTQPAKNPSGARSFAFTEQQLGVDVLALRDRLLLSTPSQILGLPRDSDRESLDSARHTRIHQVETQWDASKLGDEARAARTDILRLIAMAHNVTTVPKDAEAYREACVAKGRDPSLAEFRSFDKTPWGDQSPRSAGEQMLEFVGIRSTHGTDSDAARRPSKDLTQATRDIVQPQAKGIAAVHPAVIAVVLASILVLLIIVLK